MKKDKTPIMIFLIFVVFGIIIGIQLDNTVEVEGDLSFPYGNDGRIQEIKNLRKENKTIQSQIEELRKTVEIYEDERAIDNIELKELRSEVNTYKLLAGHLPVEGQGIVITMEGMMGENIAMIVERRRYLINLINELKVFGAEVIAINNHRITARSEISFSGNHIHVNTTPIAPPYIIQAIGDINSFKRYVEFRTLLFELMLGDGIKTEIQFEEKIKIPALSREKPLQFYRLTEEIPQ